MRQSWLQPRSARSIRIRRPRSWASRWHQVLGLLFFVEESFSRFSYVYPHPV